LEENSPGPTAGLVVSSEEKEFPLAAPKEQTSSLRWGLFLFDESEGN